MNVWFSPFEHRSSRKKHFSFYWSVRARKWTRCWFQHSVKKLCSKIVGSNAFLFVQSTKQQTKAPESRLLPFEHEECNRNRLNQDSCNTKAPWMFDSPRWIIAFLEKSISLSIVILSNFWLPIKRFHNPTGLVLQDSGCLPFQCFSSRKTNPSFWRFSLTPSYAPQRKTEKFLCENLLVSKETKKFSIFYLLAFKRQKSKILGWICCLFEKAIESIGKTAGVKKIKNRKGTVKNIEKRPKKLT